MSLLELHRTVFTSFRSHNFISERLRVLREIIENRLKHESEMFVRSIFTEPINGVAYQATWRALMKDKNVTDAIIERYPPMCQDKNLEQNENATKSCIERICNLTGICGNVTDLSNYISDGVSYFGDDF